MLFTYPEIITSAYILYGAFALTYDTFVDSSS